MPRTTDTRRRARVLWQALTATLGFAAIGEAAELVRLEVEPASTTLVGRRDRAQVLATGHYDDGTTRDLTREVTWSVEPAGLVEVRADGVVTPGTDGAGRLVAHAGSAEAAGSIEVARAAEAPSVGFSNEVLPALTRAGCNQGACHGTPTGKNGFRLSLRGFDPALDMQTLTREVGTRRTNPFEPDRSLVLLKATGAVDHQGGQRFNVDSPCYAILRDWVAEGLKPDPADAPRVVGLEVFPARRVLDEPAREQQLAVRATFSDGLVRDVTHLAKFSSSDEARLRVDEQGRVRKVRRGEAAFLAGYQSFVATSTLAFLDRVEGFAWPNPPEANVVDTHVFAKLKQMRIPPSGLADDATFLRRVTFDLTGLPPTPDRVRAFLADDRADKRAREIDALLDSPEYVDAWTLKWADRLGCNQRFTGIKGAYSYHRWIRDQVARNVPLDEFARSIVVARGSNYTNPQASFYRRIRTPEDRAETVSQLFLGVRIQCARCHNHVSERWTQDDYYGFAAFFAQVRYKNGPQAYAQYNKEETVFLDAAGSLVQPRTGRAMPPRPLGGEPPAIEPGDDRREALADWMTSPDNPFFARAAVNRLWYHVMGRGIVDPVDDMRESNPPSSPELLDALARELTTHRFDTKHVLRLILNSRTYQLDSKPLPGNGDDDRNFSHAIVKLLPAEALLDAASRVAGVAEPLFHLPAGMRAAQVPDGELVHPFLKTFGQPPRAEACECERGGDTTLEQAMQLVGGRTIHAKVSAPSNRIGRLLEAGTTDAALVEELFLASLGRAPAAAELDEGTRAIASAPSRRAGAEDLLWSLLNHPEFLFRH